MQPAYQRASALIDGSAFCVEAHRRVSAKIGQTAVEALKHNNLNFTNVTLQAHDYRRELAQASEDEHGLVSGFAACVSIAFFPPVFLRPRCFFRAAQTVKSIFR